MGNIGDGIVGLFFVMFALLCVFVPLGLWKAVELISYLAHHIGWIQ